MTLRSAVELTRFVVVLLRAFIRILEPEAAIFITSKVATAALPDTLDPNATVDPRPTGSNTQRILPPAKTRPVSNSSTSVILTETTCPTPPTQRILPPTKTRPVTNSSTSVTLSKTSYPNATVGPSSTGSNTQRVLPSANTKSPIRTGPPIVNVSSCQKTNTAATVGSVKRCKERINFIFNMMNEHNLQTKCNEVKSIIAETEEKCIPWLARYIVTNRINIELNHHTVYLNFLNSLNSEKLSELITVETEAYIKDLNPATNYFNENS
ncbi:CCR4-NOT transcription complex subunit 1, CAF1-binding domain [Cinara cedri]|uniref:CCR4-NOT transcription complex subunit 1, CAF1-binding domain n=1 Tax=Cinara cedri TaxID=506608 RepID=A0A5E4N2C9_9HEMI|nr:CCR4-NOT transcription complex subunit 1, CAF1-binding domain [Cinara cedri]